ncbi:MAG: hypothetical protein OXF79_15550 [Chloroflexi bacterium]|nr:hypothetical protein [Chloroflexota bacterium]
MAIVVCYLCGKTVEKSDGTGDHVVPRTLLDHKKPKNKGFEYGGRLYTHAECNNRFGEETYVRKALALLGALHDSHTTIELQTTEDPSIRTLALNEEGLLGFNRRDFQFFGIHDARNDSVLSFSSSNYFSDKPRGDPIKRPLNTTLSVLAKSAAAILMRRHLSALPSSWNIIAIPYAGDVSQLDLSSFLGEAKPFDIGVKVWSKRFQARSWATLYIARTVMVWFFFLMDREVNLVQAVSQKFQDEQCFCFQGESLMQLVNHDWSVVRPT